MMREKSIQGSKNFCTFIQDTCKKHRKKREHIYYKQILFFFLAGELETFYLASNSSETTIHVKCLSYTQKCVVIFLVITYRSRCSWKLDYAIILSHKFVLLLKK